MLVDFLVERVWLGPLMWAALYVSDYALTIAGARRYAAQEHIVFEGSYEITPMFQADIDALRTISPRFVVALVATTAYVWLVGSLGRRSAVYADLYVGVLGAMILLQATIHVRHLRNWFLFSRGVGSIKGRITYLRALMLRMSAFELFLFAGLYAFLFLVTGSVFILGGCLACGVLGLNHYRLLRRWHDAPASKAA